MSFDEWVFKQKTIYKNEHWIAKKAWNEQQKKIDDLNLLINRLEFEAENLECVKMFLDDKGIPSGDKDGEYSPVGRICKLIELELSK